MMNKETNRKAMELKELEQVNGGSVHAPHQHGGESADDTIIRLVKTIWNSIFG